MTQFSYSFCIAMLHSFWQAALLVMLYICVDKIIYRNHPPLAKRNFLYIAISVQLILFLLTFSIYFFNAHGFSNFSGFVKNINVSISSDNLQIFTPWVFSLYVLIIGYRLIKAIYCWYHFKQQYKTGLVKPSVNLKLFTQIKAHQFGIKRKVKLWLSSSINTPVTFGFFKPIILLPVTLLNNISTQQAETLILHELTHIRTNDYLLNWFLIIAETIFFFNPFVTMLCKKVRLEREKNCDINVISFEYAPALYAQTLLQAERIKQGVPNFQLAAVNSKKHLLQRIQFFTSDKVHNQTPRFNIIAPLIGLVLLVMLSAAILMQAGKSDLPLNSASDMRYIPFNNYFVSDVEFDKPFKTAIINNTVTEAAQKYEHEKAIIENEKAIIENETRSAAEPVCEPEPKKIEEVAKPINVNFALPVAITENDATRQIIVKEEGSGAASVKVYYLSFENGKWVLQPEWAITANQIITDTIIGKSDSLKRIVRRVYPAQQ